MTSDLTISVGEIRAAIGRVLDAVEREHGPELTFGHDYYWALPVAASFDMTAAAPTLTAGQVSNDIEEIRELADGPDVVATWHELAHALGVLRAVEALIQP
jgi:hypothetical protein